MQHARAAKKARIGQNAHKHHTLRRIMLSHERFHSQPLNVRQNSTLSRDLPDIWAKNTQ